MFDRDRFIEDCVAAVRQENSHCAVQEVVARAVAEPAAILRGLGEPTKAGPQVLYDSEEITILNVVWPGYCVLPPHEHQMWSVMGLYSGREDNIFWRRLPSDGKSHVEAAGAKSLSTGDVFPLGRDAVHSVVNPLSQLSCAIHIYGGRYFHTPRSEWDAESLEEKPLDLEALLRRIQQSS